VRSCRFFFLQEGVPQCVNRRIGEAQRRGPLAVHFDGAVDLAKRRFGQHAIMRHPLDLQQPAVGGKADLAQLRQIVQPLTHPEIPGVVDRGLRPQRPPLLVVLLDPRVL